MLDSPVQQALTCWRVQGPGQRSRKGLLPWPNCLSYGEMGEEAGRGLERLGGHLGLRTAVL